VTERTAGSRTIEIQGGYGPSAFGGNWNKKGGGDTGGDTTKRVDRGSRGVTKGVEEVVGLVSGVE